MLTNTSESEKGTEPCTFRHRNPAATDYIVVSRAILTGYPNLTDGAKLTYLAICSYDWYEPSKGGRKGYVFPTIGRLAQLRNTTPRTIQRHLGELIQARLLTRLVRRGKASVIYIEEPTSGQSEQSPLQPDKRDDIHVRGGVTSVSEEANEHKPINLVNGIKNTGMEEEHRTTSGWTPIRALLTPLPHPSASPNRAHWLADEILAQTGDAHSLGCYRAIASRCPQELVFEAISLLKEARRDGSIQQSRGALFVGIVRRLCRERGLADPLAAAPASAPALETWAGVGEGNCWKGEDKGRS